MIKIRSLLFFLSFLGVASSLMASVHEDLENQQTQRVSLQNLPPEILQNHLFPYLDSQDLLSLHQTCQLTRKNVESHVRDVLDQPLGDDQISQQERETCGILFRRFLMNALNREKGNENLFFFYRKDFTFDRKPFEAFEQRPLFDFLERDPKQFQKILQPLTEYDPDRLYQLLTEWPPNQHPPNHLFYALSVLQYLLKDLALFEKGDQKPSFGEPSLSLLVKAVEILQNEHSCVSFSDIKEGDDLSRPSYIVIEAEHKWDGQRLLTDKDKAKCHRLISKNADHHLLLGVTTSLSTALSVTDIFGKEASEFVKHLSILDPLHMVKYIPYHFFYETKSLKSLDLTCLTSLWVIFPGFLSGGATLEEFDASAWVNLEEINAGFFGAAKNLKRLNMSGLKNLKKIHNGFLSGTHLKHIDTSSWINLKSIGRGFLEYNYYLESFDASGLVALKRIGDYTFPVPPAPLATPENRQAFERLKSIINETAKPEKSINFIIRER